MEITNARREKFKSDSDVLAFLISKDGLEKTISKLEGMYAIAVYNEASRTLQIARDFPGIKPLYYYNSGARVMVCSDLNTIADELSAEPNYDYFSELLAFRHVLTPNTLYRGIYQCSPGSMMTFSLNENRDLGRLSLKYTASKTNSVSEKPQNWNSELRLRDPLYCNQSRFMSLLLFYLAVLILG